MVGLAEQFPTCETHHILNNKAYFQSQLQGLQLSDSWANQLWRHSDPVASPSDQGFGINGTKTELMADIETSFVDSPGASNKSSSAGGISYQVLNIPPSETRAL